MPAEKVTRKSEARRCTEAMRDLLLGYRAAMEDALRDTGITLPQLRMLKAIREQQESSAAAIARRCNITPQTLQAMLTRATREGWITRGSSQRNHRFVTASLTPAGEAVLQRGMQLADTIETTIWSRIPLTSMQAVRSTLERALANLDPADS